MYTLSLILLHILTLYDFYSTAQLDQRFLRSMNSFHIQEHHLHSISALLCLKTRDLFAVSISKSSLACTIHNCTAACTLLHFCSECLHWSALHCPSLHCFTLHCTSLYYFTLHCPSLHAWLCALCVVFIAALCWPQSRIFLCTVWLFICNTPAMQFLL